MFRPGLGTGRRQFLQTERLAYAGPVAARLSGRPAKGPIRPCPPANATRLHRLEPLVTKGRLLVSPSTILPKPSLLRRLRPESLTARRYARP